MKRGNAAVMVLLLGIVSIIAMVSSLQRPLDWALVLAAWGFVLFTLGWIGMYFRLARELPNDALVGANYLNLPFARSSAAANVFKLVRSHFSRHRLDLWGVLLGAGVALVAAAIIVGLTRPR